MYNYQQLNTFAQWKTDYYNTINRFTNLIKIYTMDALQRMWREIRKIHSAANLDAKDYEARMYKGIKMVKSESGIRVYSAETDFYREITIWFDRSSSSFLECAHEYLKHKYLNKLDEVERRVKEEINSTKNHKRVAALKVRRTNLLNKYNEINTKEAPGR